MTAPYRLHEALPELTSPTLVVMLAGWIDAGSAAASALAAVEEACTSRVLATFDSDTFVDYRARRPMMELREGVNTRLVWPTTELKVGRDQNGLDVLTLGGPEPDSNWHNFADAVSSLAVELGVAQMVALGAYPFATPHTRPPRLSGSSPSEEIAAGLPYLKNSVDVPAGMGAVLEHALFDKQIPAMTIWAQVPHYVSSMGYPAATVALLSGLREITGILIDAPDIRQGAIIQRERLDQLVSANEEHIGMVHQLEQLYDSSAEESLGLGSAAIPSGDEIAAELERYLREQGD
ncbi:MAG: PAC2 family protein [Ilumatobacteraceae bacterium]